MSVKTLIKSFFGDSKRQKTIGRLFIGLIVTLSMSLVSLAFFYNLSSLNKSNNAVLIGISNQSKILSLDLKVKKMNAEIIKSDKIATNNLLFQSLDDISGFVDYVSKVMDKNNYLVQFKMLKTVKDKEFNIYKTTVYFEFVNIQNNGSGYERGLSGLNEALKGSDRKVDLLSLNIFGNLNDINKIILKTELWCNFEYKTK